ncbi:unnamed protein product, partial [Closterium sp. Naga37s-1]
VLAMALVWECGAAESRRAWRVFGGCFMHPFVSHFPLSYSPPPPSPPGWVVAMALVWQVVAMALGGGDGAGVAIRGSGEQAGMEGAGMGDGASSHGRHVAKGVLQLAARTVLSVMAWRGLAWGMVPLLMGAMCACTWHFFYNSLQLEVCYSLTLTSPHGACPYGRHARVHVALPLQLAATREVCDAHAGMWHPEVCDAHAGMWHPEVVSWRYRSRGATVLHDPPWQLHSQLLSGVKVHLSFMTLLGNCTVCFAAFRIYQASTKAAP